jgi:hypothetical protein
MDYFDWGLETAQHVVNHPNLLAPGVVENGGAQFWNDCYTYDNVSLHLRSSKTAY